MRDDIGDALRREQAAVAERIKAAISGAKERFFERCTLRIFGPVVSSFIKRYHTFKPTQVMMNKLKITSRYEAPAVHEWSRISFWLDQTVIGVLSISMNDGKLEASERSPKKESPNAILDPTTPEVFEFIKQVARFDPRARRLFMAVQSGSPSGDAAVSSEAESLGEQQRQEDVGRQGQSFGTVSVSQADVGPNNGNPPQAEPTNAPLAAGGS